MTNSRRCALAMLVIAALTRAVVAEPAEPAPVDDLPAGRVKFRVLGSADGLHNAVVHSVVQDGAGLLWAATADGVYRFDGEAFEHFSVREGLLSPSPVSLGVAPDGGVCVADERGLVCWDGSGFSHAGAAGLPPGLAINMASANGKMWIGIKGHGLYVRGQTGGFVPAPGWPGAPTTSVRALWADADGVVIGNGAGVEISAGDGRWHKLNIALSDEPVGDILRDRDGALWIRSQNHLWLVPRDQTRVVDLFQGLPPAYTALGARATMVNGPRGIVLVATDEGVAYRDSGRWRMIQSDAGTPRAVRSMVVDRDGTVWLASAGLVQLRGRGLIEQYTAASGLPGEMVWDIVRDREGRMIVATNHCAARATAGRWACLPGTEGRFVSSLVVTAEGGMFVGGAPSDLLYFDPAGHLQAIDKPGRPERNIEALAIGPEGDLWIGRGDGLERLRGARPGPIEPVELPGVRANATIGMMVPVGDQLWVSSTDGLLMLDHGVWRRFAESAGLRSARPAELIARRDGRLCVGYTEPLGLTCFRYRGSALTDFVQLTAADGLSSDSVYSLGEDRAGRLWVGTSSGVDIVTEQAEATRFAIDHLDETDGLAGNDSAGNAFLLDRDGSVWQGATGGVSHIFAQDYTGPRPPPRTLFLAGQLGDQPIRDALTVPHDRNALQLALAAGSMVDSKRVEYQERLIPLERDWSTTHQRSIRYPALPPGNYRFDARSRIDGGPWGPASQLSFAVIPAWWQTRWFAVLAAICGLAASAAAVTWRQRIVMRRRTRRLNEAAVASFRAVVDLMPELISLHRGRELLYLNKAMQQLIGVERTDGKWELSDLSDRVHPDYRRQASIMLAGMTELAPREISPITELMLRSADGSWRNLEVSGIRIEIGGVATVVTSARDVTERKRMQAKLLVSDRMASLGTLAAGIAHEINNPLAFVTGNLEAIEETLERDRSEPTANDIHEVFAALHDARDGAERVRKIVLGLRTFSRSSDEENRVPLELTSILDAAIRMTGNEVRHRAQLVRETATVPLVIGDDGRLTQVFINLLVNAAHAISEGNADSNQIIVRTLTDASGNAVTEIEDTGKGMPPDVLARVFDPFFTTKDVGVGTGLGLSICHGIVSAFGGQIAIESPPEHRVRAAGDGEVRPGTLVRVTLPAHAGAPAPVAAPPAATAAPSLNRRHRVMIVDDEPQVAHSMERLLRSDCDVTIAQCGREAIAHITGGASFDAIVSDVMMPNMTGIELIEELRRIAPDQAQRLIFLSGGAFTPEARQRLDQIGAPQLEKPISGQDLRSWIVRIAGAVRTS